LREVLGRESGRHGAAAFPPSHSQAAALAVQQRAQQEIQPMGKHVAISPSEAADRLAIRELVEAYAHCADCRDAQGQMSLFTPDTHFVVFMNAKDPARPGTAFTRGARSRLRGLEQV
jgi:hypothetical protein